MFAFHPVLMARAASFIIYYNKYIYQRKVRFAHFVSIIAAE